MSKLSEIARAIKPEGAYRYRVIVLCFLAASTFWFFNALNEDYSATVRYPLEFIYDFEKYVAVDELPQDIQLNVSGLGWNLLRNNLGIKVTPIRVPLENPLEIKKISGSAMPVFLADQLNEFDLNFVITDTLNIHIDLRGDRLINVAIDSSLIDLENDYRIVSPLSISPDTIRLYGPVDVLNELPDTIALNLPQRDIDEDYEEIIPVTINHSKAGLLSRNPPTVAVGFTVSEFTKSSRLVGISSVGFPENSELVPADITINYVIPVEDAGNIDINQFEIIAEYEKLNPSDSTVIPSLSRVPETVIDVTLDSTVIKVVYNE
ncbi:MAG: hypothetical protein AAF149_16355 [Bacteroidota bacterium]